MKLIAAHQIRTANLDPSTEIVKELFESLVKGDTRTLRRLAGARMSWLGQTVSAGELTDIAEEREISLVEGSVRATAGWQLGALADELGNDLFDGSVEVTDTVALADLQIGGQMFTAGVVVGKGAKPVRRVFDPSRAKDLLDAIR
jgi:hypothetical protein